MRRDEILGALTALGAELAERGLVADLYVVGGAAITLAYDERRATKDIDAVFVPKNEVYAAAARVADSLDLRTCWRPAPAHAPGGVIHQVGHGRL
ncbi:MAG: DUF6036 family nucleotidyltransferase [Stackebrandtia sp.]